MQLKQNITALLMALQAKRFFGFRKPNAIKAFMNIPLISLCIRLYLLALRRAYLLVSDYHIKPADSRSLAAL